MIRPYKQKKFSTKRRLHHLFHLPRTYTYLHVILLLAYSNTSTSTSSAHCSYLPHPLPASSPITQPAVDRGQLLHYEPTPKSNYHKFHHLTKIQIKFHKQLKPQTTNTIWNRIIHHNRKSNLNSANHDYWNLIWNLFGKLDLEFSY